MYLKLHDSTFQLKHNPTVQLVHHHEVVYHTEALHHIEVVHHSGVIQNEDPTLQDEGDGKGNEQRAYECSR